VTCGELSLHDLHRRHRRSQHEAGKPLPKLAVQREPSNGDQTYTPGCCAATARLSRSFPTSAMGSIEAVQLRQDAVTQVAFVFALLRPALLELTALL
jgi:hypothetical protein